MEVICGLGVGFAVSFGLAHGDVLHGGWLFFVFVVVSIAATVMFAAMDHWATHGSGNPSESDSDGGYSCGGGHDY
ncbi:hypothetical protein [Streptomyces sp. NPDC007264]|uniref:hypothetical protein n=1 Tax=Streptomyces sp. NPDC007264 TaxID=3364777 RepID=UPI0036D9B12B